MNGGPWPDMKIAFSTLHADAVLRDRLIIGSQQKVCLVAAGEQFRAVEAPHRAAANNGDLH